MNKIYFATILILFLACSDYEAANQTLDRSIDHAILENLRTFNGMEATIRDKGMIKDDAILLETIKNLYKAKEYFKLPNSSKNFETNFKISQALDYLDSLQSTYSANNITIDDKIISSIEELSSKNGIDESTRNRLIYANILQLEWEFLFNRMKRIGVHCGFFGCFTFSLNTNNDTIDVGHSFESILTINNRWIATKNLSFDSISVSINGLPVQFEDRNIGNAHHLQFTAEQTGVYKYSGVLIVRNHELDYEVTSDFEYDIVSR